MILIHVPFSSLPLLPHRFHLKNLFKSFKMDISMMIMCDASDVMEFDRWRAKLSNAQLNMKQDTISIEY